MGFGRRVAEGFYIPPVYQGRKVVTSVGVAGQQFDITGLPEAGFLNQVAVSHQAGSATKFTVRVFKGPPAIALNKIFEYEDWLVTDGTMRILLDNLSYSTPDEEQKLTVEIVPDAGADNDFDTELVCIVGY